ncbi:MAG: phosphoribosyltransferase family protein [Pseudomonadota bacterium]
MKTLFTEEEIAARIDAMAEEIVAALPKDALLAPILTGAFVFAADLARGLARKNATYEIDFMHLSSYGGARASTGVVKLLKDLTVDVKDRTVLLIDDVLDTGGSLFFARRLLLERRVADVKVCVLVDKKTGRADDINADFIGFEAPADAFLVGYGMDDKGQWRGFPYIGTAE